MSVQMAEKINFRKKTQQKGLLSHADLISAYELMFRSRLLDEKMLILLKQGKSYFHIGCMGHEAVQAACAHAMKKSFDYLFPYYRDQALVLGLGQTVKECYLSFLARRGDPHGAGRQMPMHYGNKRINVPTSSSSTGTQFLQALGNALACERRFLAKETKERAVTVCTAGDGTSSQGEFYEAISWAAREKAPIVFLIENNRYAISVEIREQRPGGRIADNFKSFYGLHVEEVDGCDVEKSYVALERAIARARSGEGPSLIEADVVRLLPHSSSDDHKKYRDESDLKKDLERDPLILLRKRLLNEEIIAEAALKLFEDELRLANEAASMEALSDEMPARSEAMAHVWSGQKEPGLSEPVIDEKSEPSVLVDAINRALSEGMKDNEKVLVFGQDVAHGKGGVFTATRGLTEKFSKNRCFNAPLAEASIVGVAIGLALNGFKPVTEIQFGDYIWTAMMQIRNELATIRYRSNNDFSAPVVIRVPIGGYIHGGLCHSQNIEATFAHFPGIKIALPSTALDAYGLLKTSLESEDPVLFLEHKALYRQNFAKSILPSDTSFKIPFGKGKIRREGKDLTIISYGILVQRALEVAEKLSNEASIEVIDLRTIVPFDRELVFQSVKKNGKALVLYEDMRFMGFGAEIAADIAENCFSYLDAPVQRLAAKDAPVPYNWDLEEEILPQPAHILHAVRELLSF
jgi:2-oxoisovalerate dehydrogenase E1 component